MMQVESMTQVEPVTHVEQVVYRTCSSQNK
jgi:hypothetical protein